MTLVPTSYPANFSDEAVHGNQNTTNNDQCPEHRWIYSVIPVYILIIAVLGIVFNVFVLMVFCLHKKACTVAEIYLGNLAAADLLLSSFLPFWAQYVAKEFLWPFNETLCKLVPFVVSMNAHSSIYFLVMISIDRYLALVHPLSHEIMRRPLSAKLGCLLVWGLSLILNIPALIYREVKHHPNSTDKMCYLTIPNSTVHDVMLVILTFIIPIFIISFFSVNIIKALSNRSIQGLTLSTQKLEQKATTLVLSVILAFLVCWMPFNIFKILRILHVFDALEQGCHFAVMLDTCRQFFNYLAFFNSVLNPILYVIVGKNFRKKVKELFKQWSKRRKSAFNLEYTGTNLSRSGKTESTLGCTGGL